MIRKKQIPHHPHNLKKAKRRTNRQRGKKTRKKKNKAQSKAQSEEQNRVEMVTDNRLVEDPPGKI